MNMNEVSRSRRGFLRATALVLAVAILVLAMPLISPDWNKVSAAGESKVSDDTSVIQDGVGVNLKKQIEDFGNGYYQLKLTASSTIKNSYRTLNQSYATNGYYSVLSDGWYLLELYGGKGGEGGYQDPVFGGKGGDGGHVYGKIYLKAGQTLIFTIGTNGATVTEADAGGGANGDGGDKGETGN